MTKKHMREILEREPYAVAHDGLVTIIDRNGGFTAAIMGSHDLFTVEELACWINVALDARHE